MLTLWPGEFERGSRLVRVFLMIVMLGAASPGAYQSIPLPPAIPPAVASPLTPDVRAAIDRISSDSLRGHLSFLASDLLEGRNTPSRGLDLAGEYIAAQFMRAGLEPVGNDGYFQTADWLLSERDMTGFELMLEAGAQAVSVPAGQVSFTLSQDLKLAAADVVKVSFDDASVLDSAPVEGKVIITEMPDFRRLPTAQSRRAQNEFLIKAAAVKSALVVSIDRSNLTGNAGGAARLIDPANRQNAGNPADAAAAQPAPFITVHSPAAIEIYDRLSAGPTPAKLSINVPATQEKPVRLRNVVGLLRGSDPVLQDTYVLVTAHYDHIGVRAGTAGDSIFNGANDDGSGTVSVIEIASVLATLKERPKRSIVFMTFFGEEKGLLGSRYYGRHPIFPVSRTVADINLEMVGRTDSSEGPQIASASMTGFDFSDVGSTFMRAGELTGITVYKHERNSDAYFGRSDNQALADQGVPAHTLCVAFDYPDYHDVGDHWDKVDYVNMAKVDRMVALGLVMISNNPDQPTWNEANPKTARYVEAWKKQHAQ